MVQDQDQDFHFCPRDQDPGLEDYITGSSQIVTNNKPTPNFIRKKT